MLISISNNKLSIENLLKQKKGQKQLRAKFNQTFNVVNVANPNEIKVISPFYQREKCSKKGPCFCPYHKLKKRQMINLIHRKLPKQSLNKCQIQQKLNKIKTQVSESQIAFDLKKIRYDSMFTQQNGRDTKDVKNYLLLDKENYMNIGHKVQCRNSQYQQFLKKNILFGLHGNNHNLLGKNKLNQINLAALQKHGDHQNYFNTDNTFDDPTKYRKVNISNLIKDKQSKYSIEKAQKLIQLILQEKLQMRISDMKQLRQKFSNLINQEQHKLSKEVQGRQKQNKNNSQSQESSKKIMQRKALLNKFDIFINIIQNRSKIKHQRKKTFIQNNEVKNINKQQLQTDNLFEFSIKNKNAIKANNLRQPCISNDMLQPHNGMFDDENEFQTKNNLKANSLLKGEQNNDMNAGLSYAMGENYKQKRISGFSSTSNCKMSKKKLRKYSKRANNQSKSLHNQIASKISQKKTKEFEAGQKQNQVLGCQYSSFFKYNQKNQKQAKFNEIMTQINDDSSNLVDKDFLKMRKYIERNRKFIRKMQMKLLHLNLGVFVIQATDSLITRKKKIRYLKQILSNVQKQSSSKKDFYDQIMKYLEIYTEHCDMIMKKAGPRKRKEEDENIYDDLELQRFCFEKKSTDSLKFISLYENNEQERQKRLDGWISIPQYITTDYARLKATKKLQKSTKCIAKIQLIENSQSQIKSQDQLVQIPLENKCNNKIIESFYLNNKQIVLSNKVKKLQQKHSFESKIENFKKKLMKAQK